MKQKIYKCDITGYSIEFLIDANDETIAKTGFVLSDYKNMKALLSLLRNSVDQLENDGIKYIVQRVDKYEWNRYLEGKTSWEIIKRDDIYNTYIIKCSITDYLENYGVGIGL